MTQFNGCPQEALGTYGGTAADYGLCPTRRNDILAWPGVQKKTNHTTTVFLDVLGAVVVVAVVVVVVGFVIKLPVVQTTPTASLA